MAVNVFKWYKKLMYFNESRPMILFNILPATLSRTKGICIREELRCLTFEVDYNIKTFVKIFVYAVYCIIKISTSLMLIRFRWWFTKGPKAFNFRKFIVCKLTLRQISTESCFSVLHIHQSSLLMHISLIKLNACYI